MDLKENIEYSHNLPKSASSNYRKVPNLKGLRDMIRKNGTTIALSPSHQINVKSERTNRNESECSFTLTSDEERDQDGQSTNGRRSSLHGKRSRSKGDKNHILVQESPIPHKQIPNNVVQEAKEHEEVDDEDLFLKELEEENKMLEMELKNLQQTAANGHVVPTAGYLPRQQEPKQQVAEPKQQEQRGSNHPMKRKNSTSSNNSQNVPVQRKIRFQDEVGVSPQRQQRNDHSRTSITPGRDTASPYQSNKSKNFNPYKTNQSSRSMSSHQSPSPKPHSLSQTRIQKPLSPSGQTQPQIKLNKRQESLTNRSIQSLSPTKESSRCAQSSQRESTNPGSIDIEKYKSLELRLMGCMRTIKSLEKENQAKTDKISSLQLELEKKNKQIEALNAEKLNISQSQQRLNVRQTLQQNSKKKEKELEAKVKDQESIIFDQKKQLSRFQELNKQLIDKVKEVEQQLLDKNSTTGSIQDELSQARKENQALKNEIKILKQDKLKSDYLEREYQLTKEKYDALKQHSVKFEQASQELYKNHLEMTQKMQQFLRQASDRGILKPVNQ